MLEKKLRTFEEIDEIDFFHFFPCRFFYAKMVNYNREKLNQTKRAKIFSNRLPQAKTTVSKKRVQTVGAYIYCII